MTNNTSPTFSCYLPRIDTRSLPPMNSCACQDEYITAVRLQIEDVFESNGLGRPNSVRLTQRHTADGYLFFIGFIHFSCEPKTASARSFRCAVAEGESRLYLENGSYWKVRKYRPSAQNDTIAQQARLQFAPSGATPRPIPSGAIPPPILKRNGFTQDSSSSSSQQFAQQRQIDLANAAKAVLGDPIPSVDPLNVDFPPLGFDRWLALQQQEVRDGYSSALAMGDATLIKQYHAEATSE